MKQTVKESIPETTQALNIFICECHKEHRRIEVLIRAATEKLKERGKEYEKPV